MLARPEHVPPLRDGAPLSAHADPEGGIFERLVRRMPIRWRILAIASFNSAVALILLGLIWNGARVLGEAWSDLRQVRQSERFLSTLDSDAERLQSLIHRFFAQADPNVLARIVDLRDTLISRLRVQARLDPLIAESTLPLTEITERFIAGFDALRDTRANISLIYETRVLRPSREMGSVFTALADAPAESRLDLRPVLARSRDAYGAMVLAANAFYLSSNQTAASEAKTAAKSIKRGAPALAGLDGLSEDARRGVERLAGAADLIEAAIGDLTDEFKTQARLLKETIDDNAAAMSAATDRMMTGVRELELSAQNRFDRTLHDVALKLAVLALAFVVLVVLMGIAIARSLSGPLGDLRDAMAAVTTGDYGRRVGGLDAADEIGEMARAVEVFRENALAKRRADEDLRLAKETAETAFTELRDAQTSLIQAEKFAALGGLVAGVAHEVNNPVGISLTVASSLAGRCRDFQSELAAGALRRSRLSEFVAGVEMAATQLVANLGRAGDLVQSFKQVAVDRSQAERRIFDLREATEQILASLRPTLKAAGVTLSVSVPDGIVMDSCPGPLGQILTNLFLNATFHAFADRPGGAISIIAHRSGPGEVDIVFRDDGRGMSAEVQRQAFDPFFTTRRGSGGTGLGLHIVYNLVTARLGGHIALSSAPDQGSTFTIVLPRTAPATPAEPDTALDDPHHVGT